MSRKIYVGNLPYAAKEEDLRDVFEKIGEVQSARILMDSATGRSRGFGFIEMASEGDTDKAIQELNGAVLMERTLTVSEARPQASRGKTDVRRKQGKSFDRAKDSGHWK